MSINFIHIGKEKNNFNATSINFTTGKKNKQRRMSCTQEPQQAESDEAVASSSTSKESPAIPCILIKPPKCFDRQGSLLASFKQVNAVCNAMIFCNCPYTARMIVFTYNGFSKLFSAFCADTSNEEAISAFIEMYTEFDTVHRLLMLSDIKAVMPTIKNINANRRFKLHFNPEVEGTVKMLIRLLFPLCIVQRTNGPLIDIRIPGDVQSPLVELYTLPLFCKEENSFDILWKYSQKASPVHTYARVVLEKLARVLNEGLYRIAQCMVLFFVYTLKLVFRLIEITHPAPDAENIKSYRKQLYGRLNSKLIKVFSLFVDRISDVTRETTYEKELRNEQLRYVNPDTDDSALAVSASASTEVSPSNDSTGSDEPHGRGCLLS